MGGVQRLIIARGFTLFEDFVYVGLGLLLAACALILIISAAGALFHGIQADASPIVIVDVLDRLLLVLMVVELLYTVKVSFQEHSLVPEPFLIVGLIAAIRRLLIVTAQLAVFVEKSSEENAFRHAMLELALLTVMVVALVGSPLMLRRRSATPSSGDSSSRSD